MRACLLWLLLVPGLFGQEPPLVADPAGWWRVALPQDLLEDASVRKKLYSGLTTTFELESQSSQDDGPHYAVLQVRYEIWEEVFVISRVDADGQVGRFRFATLAETATWLAENPLRIAPKRGDDQPADGRGARLTCRVRLIPFSQSEGRLAEDWFAKVLRVPDAVTTGQSDASRERALDESSDGGGIFEVLMSKSIRRKSIRSVRWQWRLDGGS